MSAPARVFSPLNAQPPADVVAQLARGAQLQLEPGHSGWRAIRMSGAGLDLRLVDTAFTDGAALFERTRALKQWIVDATPKGPTASAFRMHRFAGRARHVFELEGFRIDVPTHQNFVLDLARLVYGVVQVDPGLLDSEGRWILDDRGVSQAGAAPREVQEAALRRKRTIALLAGSKVMIPEGLSLVESEDEALLCPAGDAKRRALALYRTFRETCGAPELAVERDADVRAMVEHELSPKERAAIASGDRQHAGMRVEALWALLFVLGAVPSLGPLAVDCSAEAAVDALEALTSRGALDGGTLRPLPEILDALDTYQCLAWALAEARGKLAAPMKGYVVQMRLRALRWTVLDQFAEWDAVSLDA
jgi:hypothetical protein